MAHTMRSLDDIAEEYEFLDGEERYRLLIELGRELDPMPDALKTDATLVRGWSGLAAVIAGLALWTPFSGASLLLFPVAAVEIAVGTAVAVLLPSAS